MELVVYGCGNEVHNSENGCEYFEYCKKSELTHVAIGFDVKQPPICDYCNEQITKNNTSIYDKYAKNVYEQPNIQSVNIRWCDYGLLDEKMHEFLNNLNRREINLKFDAVRMDDKQAEKIVQQLQSNESIENLFLSLNGNMVSDKTLEQLKIIFKNKKDTLKNIQLSLRNNEINDSNSKYLGESLETLGDQLETLSLNIDECPFDSEGIQNITFNLPKYLKNFSFSYDDNMIGDEQLKQFCNNMKFDKNNLKELDLNFSQNEFGDEGLIALSERISTFSELRQLTLNFRRNSISNEGLESLFSNLSKLSQLESIQLNISGIYENSLPCIDTFLEKAVNLQKLMINMQDNNTIDDGIQLLCKGIKTQKNIKDISLNFFYGQISNLDLIFTTLINEIINNDRNFGELNIITDNTIAPTTQQLSNLLDEICLNKFQTIIQLIQFNKIYDTNNLNQQYILDLLS